MDLFRFQSQILLKQNSSRISITLGCPTKRLVYYRFESLRAHVFFGASLYPGISGNVKYLWRLELLFAWSVKKMFQRQPGWRGLLFLKNETIDHLFFNCSMVRPIWHWIAGFKNIHFHCASRVMSLGYNLSIKGAKLLNHMFCLLWVIRKEINRICFTGWRQLSNF